VALVLGLTACQSLAEGAGLLLLIPMLQLVGLEVQPGGGRVAELMSAGFGALGLRPTLLTVLRLYVLAFRANPLWERWQTSAGYALQHELVFRLRQRLYRAIANADWLFFARSRSSDFTHALTTELDRVGLATQQLLQLIVSAAVGCVYLVFALQLSPAVTAGAVC